MYLGMRSDVNRYCLAVCVYFPQEEGRQTMKLLLLLAVLLPLVYGQPITLPAGNAQAVNITINVTEGENVTFMCEIIPGVTLTLNVRLPGGSFVAALPGLRPPNLRLDGGQTFTFLNAQRRDNGIAFQCRGDGRNTTDIGVISVQFPPDFVTITSNLRCRGSECAILTGATGYLECSATGVPTPTVTLTNATAVSDNVMISGTRVTITNAVAGNVANFTCNASNIVSSTVQTYQLWVGGVPTFNSSILNESDDNVTITWVFNENGVPFISSNVSTDCETSTGVSSVYSSMTGTQVIKFTQRPPPDTMCTVTVHVANLLGSIDRQYFFTVPESTATMMTTTFRGSVITPTMSNETVTTVMSITSGAAAFSATIFSILLLMVTSSLSYF